MVEGTCEQLEAWYAGGSREERLREAMGRNRLDVLLALTPENAAYLSGRTSTIATLWRLPGLVAVAVNGRGERAVASGDNEVAGYGEAIAHFAHPLWIEHLDLRGHAGSLIHRVAAARPEGTTSRPAQYEIALMLDAIAAAAGAVAGPGRRLGVELPLLPGWLVGGLQDRLPEVELVDALAIFDDLRAIKDPDEIANLLLAAELTGIGISAARDAARPGMGAVAVTGAYQCAIWQAAAGDARYAGLREVEGLVAVGDGSQPVAVGPGQTIKLDMQVDVGGYHSDVGRTYAIAPTADQQQVFDALRHALDRALATVGPGVPYCDVWRAGMAAMRAQGFAGYSRGHLGHSVGLAHNYEEPPFVAAGEPRPIVPGMVISVELPYYLLGVGSFQMERMVAVGESGAEVLDRLPFALAIDPGG